MTGETGMLAALTAAIVAFGACAAMVPIAIGVGRRWKFVDEPGGRRQHEHVVPRTGGIAVAGGLVAGFGAAFALGVYGPAAPPPGASPFIAATLIVFAVGLIDDARGCPVSVKLLGQTAAAVVVASAGHSIDVVSTPFGRVELVPAVGLAATILWLVGITNAMNLMDGLDGLGSGVTAIIASSLAVIALAGADIVSSAGTLVLCGVCVGFLCWNWRPARIFLGDSGSLTLGFVLACMSLTASLKAGTAVAVFVPLLVLGVPAIDTLFVIGARFRESPSAAYLSRLRRTVRADRRHVHHQLLTMTDHRTTVLTLYGVVAACCLLALFAIYVNSPLLATITLLVEIGVVALLRGVRTSGRAPVAPLVVDGGDPRSEQVERTPST